MFTIVAAMIFFAAFLLAIGTIGWMFAFYHHKMTAALLFEPIPQDPPAVCHVRIRRPRVIRQGRRVEQSLPHGVLAA